MHQPIQVHRIFFQSKQDYYELVGLGVLP